MIGMGGIVETLNQMLSPNHRGKHSFRSFSMTPSQCSYIIFIPFSDSPSCPHDFNLCVIFAKIIVQAHSKRREYLRTIGIRGTRRIQLVPKFKGKIV
jgi:hypothetical protein